MNPRERQQAQEDFRTGRQICVATEAAGEGINLQFCHLMINYDLPWNPTRLGQRLGRIHRIGQTRDVYAFNFVATSSEDGQPVIEGRILERLLGKLDRMREALGDRVFDVVGEVLSLNKVNAAVDEKLNELLHDVVGRTAVYVDSMTAGPYRLHFYEITVRGQTTKGEATTILAELAAVREEVAEGVAGAERFGLVPADVLIDLPEHPHPPETLSEIDYGPVSDYVKTTVQMERRSAARDERGRYGDVAHDYLQRSFDARVRAAQDRVMRLLHRESKEPEMALARQRAEQDLADLDRTRQERLAGVDRLRVARHGPVRHVASCLVLPPDTAIDSFPELGDEQDAALKRRVELAAEDVVVAYEEARNRDCERVGHLKIGFDIRSLAAPDPQTGYRDPVAGVRRIEVKGRRAGRPVRLTTNEWYKAQQLRDTYWLYVVWDPLEDPDAVPVMVRNPARHLDYAKKEVVAARYYDVPASAVEEAAHDQREGGA